LSRQTQYQAIPSYKYPPGMVALDWSTACSGNAYYCACGGSILFSGDGLIFNSAEGMLN